MIRRRKHIERDTRLAVVDHIRAQARSEHGRPGSAHRRSALGRLANELEKEARRG